MSADADVKGLTLAAGPIGVKQELFAFTEDYTEACYLGPMGTGKSRALCLGIIQSALDYPGCRLFLCRDELATLKKTTLDTLLMMLSQAGIRYEHNKNDAIVTIEPGALDSRVYCFGLNTGDYKEKLKSFEPLRIFMDEAHAVGEDKLEFALMRQGRHRVRHRQSYRERIDEGISEGRFKGYEDGMRHFRISGDELGIHGEGRGYVKYVSNDMGNDWIWGRVVNQRGDKPHPDSGGMSPAEFERWVHENVGITKLFITPDMEPAFTDGDIVRLPDGRAAEVSQVHATDLVVDAGTERLVVPRRETTLVLERLAVYGFSLENHSLSEDNIRGFYYVKKKTRDQYLHGLTDTQTGLMFPMFSTAAHVIPESPIPENWHVFVGLDYNVDIVCAAFLAENPNGDLVVFNEYEGFEGAAAAHASEIISRIDHPWERVKVFYDSSMNARDAVDPTKSVAKIYEQAGLRRMRIANKDRTYGAQRMRELLEVRYVPGFAPRPGLWLMDNAQSLIRGSEHNAGLMDFTWELFRQKRRDHLMDALRYAIASRSKYRPEEERPKAPKSHARQWLRV